MEAMEKLNRLDFDEGILLEDVIALNEQLREELPEKYLKKLKDKKLYLSLDLKKSLRKKIISLDNFYDKVYLYLNGEKIFDDVNQIRKTVSLIETLLEDAIDIQKLSFQIDIKNDEIKLGVILSVFPHDIK